MPIFYILAGLIGVIIGWFIGFLDSNLRMSKKIRAIENNAEIMIEEAGKKIAQLKKEYAEANPTQDDPGLLRLKKVNGRYLLELDGVTAPAELTLDMRKRLVELITVFRLWLDPAQFSTSASQPVVTASTSRPAEVDPIREAVYGSGQTVQPAPEPVREAAPIPAPISPQPVKPVAPVKKPEPEKDIKSLSIVQQIDTVLQGRLLTSHLAGRGIRLQESIQGGVEVYVGSQKFDAVDEVPDEEIKAAIRSAITEWEKKYTPGM